MSRIDSYAWDSSIFLAWIKGEKRSDEEDAALEAAADDVDAGRTRLICSVLVFCEVLEARLQDDQQRLRFRQIFQRDNIHLVETTPAIAREAGALRLECSSAGLKLTAEDAVHVATAMVMKASELHTYDPHQLRMNRMPCLHGLQVVAPRGSQRKMTYPEQD